MEILKLSVTMLRSGCRLPEFNSQSVRASLKFLLPSIIYTINNNIYLAGLILVPPPVWMILCSFRTMVTICVYKFFLRREVTNIQILGSFLIVGGIVCAKLGEFKVQIKEGQLREEMNPRRFTGEHRREYHPHDSDRLCCGFVHQLGWSLCVSRTIIQGIH